MARSTSSPPSSLDGSSNGTENQPNLYLAAPDSAPRFIATLSPDDPLVLDCGKGSRNATDRRLPGHPHGRIRRLPVDPAAGRTTKTPATQRSTATTPPAPKLNCASAIRPTLRPPATPVSPPTASASPNDGRVFFNSTDALSPRDLDEKKDAYEWEPSGTGTCQEESPSFNKATGDCIGLISTGTSPFASSLLGVSANGTDAYFFTRDKLIPQDQNGQLVKIYDARS